MPKISSRSRKNVNTKSSEFFEEAEGQREAPRARLVGENIDEGIVSGEDEEIESDDAFEESDEERFAGFFSSKNSRHGTKSIADVDLNENEEMDSRRSEDTEEDDYEDTGDDDEFMDLVDVLDGKREIDASSDKENKSKRKRSSNDAVEDNEESPSDEAEGDEEEVDGDDDDEEEIVFEPSDEDAQSALEKLQKFVSDLDVTAKKRKAPDNNNERRTRQRRLLKEKTEAGEENEFHVPSAGAKLNLDDLLAPLAGQSSTLQSLKRTTEVLARSGSSKVKTLSAPLPYRAQERLDREAAYEQTKEEVDKWSDTMKRIREAEHLSFPLQAQSSTKPSNVELNAKFKPTTDLERSVDNILKASKLREEDIYQKEDTMLEMNRLSVEEIAQRRNELRQMRDLIFRAEIKSRRVKKIKSKTYRSLKRKEMERLGKLIDEKELEEEDESGGQVLYQPGALSNMLSKTDSLGQPPSEASSVTFKSTDLLSPPPPSPDINPWLVRKDEYITGKVARTKNDIVVSKDSKTSAKAKHRLDKQASKNSGKRSKAMDDGALQISLDDVLRLPSRSTSKKVRHCEDDSGEESGIEGKVKSRGAFQQRDLVALAFAGDNVVQSFEEAKRREIAADAPREVDTTIPGWGSWGGTGIRKAPPKPERIKVIPGINPARRADHGKKNVIISEKRDKKVAKYFVKDLPYPYTSKAQFERAMEIPLGTEWNTRVGFQRGTLPRVVKKPGVIIEPLQKLSS